MGQSNRSPRKELIMSDYNVYQNGFEKQVAVLTANEFSEDIRKGQAPMELINGFIYDIIDEALNDGVYLISKTEFREILYNNIMNELNMLVPELEHSDEIEKIKETEETDYLDYLDYLDYDDNDHRTKRSKKYFDD